MEFNGYSIQVSTFRDGLRTTFHSTFIIRRGDRTTASETVAGDLKTFADAEREGYRAARKWIEQQPEINAEARSPRLRLRQPLYCTLEHGDQLADRRPRGASGSSYRTGVDHPRSRA